MNKSVDDLIGLGIADEANSNYMKGKVNKETSEETETIARIEAPRQPARENRRFQQRYPRTSQRGKPFGGQQGYTRQYPYAPSQNTGQRQTAHSANQLQCYNCQKYGHIARNCRNRKVFAVFDEQVKVNELLE